MGDSRRPFYFIGIAAVLNIVLDILFVKYCGMQVFGAAQVASEKLCPKVSPSVSPHTVQVFGAMQVASEKLCPKASPSVSPHAIQVFGAVQVASLYRKCLQLILVGVFSSKYALSASSYPGGASHAYSGFSLPCVENQPFWS